MAVKLGLLALLEAKPGKGEDLGAFLEADATSRVAEEGTVTWYAFKIDDTHYGIFDTFETEEPAKRTSTARSRRRSPRSPASCSPPTRHPPRRHPRRQVERTLPEQRLGRVYRPSAACSTGRRARRPRGTR